MGGQRGVDRSSGQGPADEQMSGSGRAPIEIVEIAPSLSPVDEVLAVVGSVLTQRSGDRPLHYAVGDGRLTLASDVPFTLAPPIGDGTARHSWTVPLAGVRLEKSPPPRGAALVSLPGPGGATSLVDLVAAQCTALVGDPDEVGRLCDRMARELCQTVAETVGVVAVGGLEPDGIDQAETLAEACALVAAATGPLVVLVADDLVGSDDFERLIAAIRRHETAAVVATAVHPDARLVIVAGRAERCGVFFRHSNSPVAAAPVRPHPTVDVSILGPIEIRGSAEALGGHPLLTELIVYLAMHPGGATTAAWETALWPDRRMPPQTIANRLSEARRALGFAADGRPRLRRFDERHLVVEVATDWDRFNALSHSEDPLAWRAALALVRGRPFCDLHEAQWVALEGFAIEIEHAIVDCALRLGRLALADDDPDAAISAAQLALRATPWDERLHRMLMVASDAAGDRAGVEATLRHLALVLEIDGDPLRAVHPETARLYARLSGRSGVLAGS